MMRNTSPTAKFRLNRLATLAILPFRKITANKRRFPRAPNTKTLDSHVTRMIWPVEEFISPKTEGLLFFYTLTRISDKKPRTKSSVTRWVHSFSHVHRLVIFLYFNSEMEILCSKNTPHNSNCYSGERWLFVIKFSWSLFQCKEARDCVWLQMHHSLISFVL